MGKLLKLAAVAGALVCGMTGPVDAFLYTQSAGNIGTDGTYVVKGSDYTWAFDTPVKFTIPGDTVNFANLVITGTPDSRLGRTNLTVAEQSFGTLQQLDGTTVNGVTTYQIDLSSLFAPNWTGGEDNLPLLLKVAQHGHDDGFTLYSAVFNLDYVLDTKATDPDVPSPTGNDTSPVPEPATLFLLGSGLAGLAVRCRSRRAA